MALILKEHTSKKDHQCEQCDKKIPAGTPSLLAWQTRVDQVFQQWEGTPPNQDRRADHRFCSKECADTWETKIESDFEEDDNDQ